LMLGLQLVPVGNFMQLDVDTTVGGTGIIM